MRFPNERLLSAIDAAQDKGQPLNANKLDRAILLLDDLPGIAVAGSLRKGEGENETDVGLKIADEPLANGEISADNTGARSTGVERLTGNLYINSPLRVGDQLSANLIHSRGTDYGRLGYSIPVGYDGWRVGVSGSSLHYKLVSEELKRLDARGASSTVGLEASYPIIRSRLRNLYLGLNADNKHFDNEANRATTTRYQIQAFAIGLNGNLFDRLGGGGANAAG
ncbi:MAG: ShlB/FhaC/HecB family hemolysin secretion/activation protein, partial [Actinobacteria bacterium]|nr:ShlB/FhaC/HecB family hemolysin secretion/activation protein [Actinomycetota bacterium]